MNASSDICRVFWDDCFIRDSWLPDGGEEKESRSKC